MCVLCRLVNFNSFLNDNDNVTLIRSIRNNRRIYFPLPQCMTWQEPQGRLFEEERDCFAVVGYKDKLMT